MFRCHIRQGFHSCDAGSDQLLNQAFAQPGDTFKRRCSGTDQRRHLLLDFLALLFFTLDVDLPAKQLCGQPDVLPLFADGEGKLAVIHHYFQVLVGRIEHSDPAHFGRL